MKSIPPTTSRSRASILILSLLLLGLWLSGCASFPGKDLPSYSYADLAPAPDEKMCLKVAIQGTPTDDDREVIETTIVMLEKSGFFLKAPEHCLHHGEKSENDIQWAFRNDSPAANRVGAFISGFISGFTFTIIPAFAREELLLSVQLRKNDQLVKEYAYREHVDTWLHLSMLFMMFDHQPRVAVREVYNRMIMNFLYDYSLDAQPAKRIAISQ
jgi:hypothetical protein